MINKFYFSITILFALFHYSFTNFNVLANGIDATQCSFHSHHSEACQLSSPARLASTDLSQLSYGLGKFIKSSAKAGRFQLKTIVIDAGHGGRDHGCSGIGSKEKNIALKVALFLGQSIEYNFPGIKVIYTRKTDVFIPLHKRAEIANRNKADLFISIHCNAIPNASHIHGSETYVLGLHRADDNLKVAKRENASILLEADYQIRYAGYDPNSAEGHIILSMFQHAYLDQSIRFAELVESQIQRQTGRKSRGVLQAGFLVLRETTMPSVLIETGYLTNRSDNAYLLTESGQRQMAYAIYKAFKEYRFELESVSYQQQQPLANAGLKKALPPKVSARAQASSGQMTAKGIPSEYLIKNASPQLKVAPAAVQYKVQLAVSANLISTDNGYWRRVHHSIEVLMQQNVYTYLAVGFHNYQEASAAKDELRKQGFKEAFVVAFQNGRRIPVDQARRARSKSR